MSKKIPFYEGRPFVFISYSSLDRSVVEEDIEKLNKRGVHIWYDEIGFGISGGAHWPAVLKARILQSKAVLFYASMNSITSKNVLEELEIAKDAGIQVIPIRMFTTGITIKDFVKENSHSFSTEAVIIANDIVKKIPEDSKYVPHRVDKYYYDVIEKAVKDCAPTTINLSDAKAKVVVQVIEPPKPMESHAPKMSAVPEDTILAPVNSEDTLLDAGFWDSSADSTIDNFDDLDFEYVTDEESTLPDTLFDSSIEPSATPFKGIQFMEGLPFIFISYSSKDREVVQNDVAELNKRGVNVWYDTGLSIGTSWSDDEVKSRVLRCSAVLFYASSNSIQSKTVLKELETALSSGKTVIPAALPPISTSIKEYLASHSYSLSAEGIETAFRLAEIFKENVFIQHTADPLYFDQLIEKNIARLAPEVINLHNPAQLEAADTGEYTVPTIHSPVTSQTPELSQAPTTVRKIRVTSYFISGGTKYYTLEFEGQVKHIKETDIISSKFMPSESELAAAPESDAEYYNIGGEPGFPALLIPDKRFILSENGSDRGYSKKALADGMLYKVAAGAFNAQAEVVASRLAKYTNIGKSVDYELCFVNGEYATRSLDFLANNEVETVETLHKKVTGVSFEARTEFLSGTDLFEYIAEIVSRGIGLDLTEPKTLSALSLLLQFDALVLNSIRNLSDIVFIKQPSATVWDLAPAHDFSSSLFSCVKNLAALKPYHNLPSVPAHSEQLNWLYQLSDDYLTFEPFNVEDLTHGVWDSSNSTGKSEIEEYLRGVLQDVSKGQDPLLWICPADDEW
jgi:hypothetical protein